MQYTVQHIKEKQMNAHALKRPQSDLMKAAGYSGTALSECDTNAPVLPFFRV